MELAEVVSAFNLKDIGDFSDGYHTFNQLYIVVLRQNV